ncbi:unnamed protein product [Pseudo-nitzschia multistriata]|uniref:Uncharacterized protein n=1 Tax=Pseudo-nitzschia multistriata TaxID=183589 RepID=A0A448YWH3_9STRA|nr:unnamed protein product [Pseudo-nitzschia multistriata]
MQTALSVHWICSTLPAMERSALPLATASMGFGRSWPASRVTLAFRAAVTTSVRLANASSGTLLFSLSRVSRIGGLAIASTATRSVATSEAMLVNPSLIRTTISPAR